MPLSAFPSCAGVGVGGKAGGTLTETRRCGLRTFLFVTGNKAPFGVGFEPTYAGYGPAALPLGYPLIAVDAFSPYKTHFYAYGSRTRRPPVSCRVLPNEANAPKMLLPVSLQSTD